MTSTAIINCEKAAQPAKHMLPGQHAKSGLKYRPDIDGLRAVAVIVVLAFHIGLSRFSGGFVGVDVFFVISGYLISSIILADIDASRFTIKAFYERRIRRIFPALFAMLAVSSVVAYIYLLPSELVDYAKSMLAATGSASNLYFWQHSGYFESPLSKPLLHTWSLAVEEQFYLSFPLILLLVRRFFPHRLRTAVILLFFVSLVISCVIAVRNPKTAFYMPYTRAWELLLGTLLSLRIFPRLESPWLRNTATLAGLGMILWSVLFYTHDTVFPGLSALLPCVGSGLIIWAGEAGTSLVGLLLSWRPVVFIGLISYSLYLWHWPIIVLRSMGMLMGVSAINLGHWAFFSAHRLDMLIDIGISFVLAVLSWKFVEGPFRNGPLRLSGRPLFALAGGVMALLLACAAWTVQARGFRGRFPDQALQVASALDSNQGNTSIRTGVCFITTEYHFEKYDFKTCLREDQQKTNYLLLGDSHSAMLWSALNSALPHSNVMQASTAACEPSLAPSGNRDCKDMMTYIFQHYLPTHSVQGLYIVARWEEKDLAPLSQLISWAKQHRIPVVVFGPVPEYDAPLPRLLAYSIAWAKPNLAHQHMVVSTKVLDTEMQRMATSKWHVRYISLYREICAAGSCLEYADATNRVPLMGDTNHLSAEGASLIVQRLVDKGELD
jgi:peptidoglycan/LPS O-acetylase OafA/YrhL